MKRLLNLILRPQNIFLVTTTMSFLAWSLPDFDSKLRKGFTHPYEVSLWGLILALCWVALIYLSSFTGFKIGMAFKFKTKLLDMHASIYDARPFSIMLIMALIGVSYVFLQIFTSLGISGMLDAISGGQANQLKSALYEGYSAGLPSLRYMAIPAAALGIYYLIRREYIILSISSIILLLAVAIVSSRLSVVYTVFIFLGLMARESIIKVKAQQIIVGFIILIHLIFALNYSRNINFYRSIGVDNFYLAGISEVVAYVGSPFQGFLAVSEQPQQLAGLREEQTAKYTGINEELTTNSAFLELVREGDIYSALLNITFSTMLSSFLMAIAWKNKNNILLLIFGALGYCFAEIWRINLFGQGIVLTIILSIIFIAFICVIFPRLTISLRRLKNYDSTRKSI